MEIKVSHLTPPAQLRQTIRVIQEWLDMPVSEVVERALAPLDQRLFQRDSISSTSHDPATVFGAQPISSRPEAPAEAASEPAVPAPVTAPPPPAAPASPYGTLPDGRQLDKDGVPYDARVHADPAAYNKDGTWSSRRKVDPALKAAVLSELGRYTNVNGIYVHTPVANPTAAGAPVTAPPPPAAPAPVQAPPVAEVPPVPAPVATPAPAPAPTAQLDYGALMATPPASAQDLMAKLYNPAAPLLKHDSRIAGLLQEALTELGITAGIPSIFRITDAVEQGAKVAAVWNGLLTKMMAAGVA